MASAHVPVLDWLELIRAEYREMPGLNLSKTQMRKLWGFDAFVCDALVDALVAAQVNAGIASILSGAKCNEPATNLISRRFIGTSFRCSGCPER